MSLCKVWRIYLGVVSNYNDDVAKDDDDVDDCNIVIKSTYVAFISSPYKVNYIYIRFHLSHFHPHEWWLHTWLRSESDKWRYCLHTRHSSPVRVWAANNVQWDNVKIPLHIDTLLFWLNPSSRFCFHSPTMYPIPNLKFHRERLKTKSMYVC